LVYRIGEGKSRSSGEVGAAQPPQTKKEHRKGAASAVQQAKQRARAKSPLWAKNSPVLSEKAYIEHNGY
jgi:hypothetical protein